MTPKPRHTPIRRSAARRAQLAVSLLAIAVMLTPATAAGQADEYAVKAALLYNFSKFLEWPEEAFVDSPEFRICIHGEDPFGREIDGISGKRTQGRPIVVSRHEGKLPFAERCHIVFVGARREKAVAAALRVVRDEPTLTVGDGSSFVDRGGMIGLVREGSRIRFEINRSEARRAGLSVSARLLRVAQRVVEE